MDRQISRQTTGRKGILLVINWHSDEGKMRDLRTRTWHYLTCFDGWNAGKYCLVKRSTLGDSADTCSRRIKLG